MAADTRRLVCRELGWPQSVRGDQTVAEAAQNACRRVGARPNRWSTQLPVKSSCAYVRLFGLLDVIRPSYASKTGRRRQLMQTWLTTTATALDTTRERWRIPHAADAARWLRRIDVMQRAC